MTTLIESIEKTIREANTAGEHAARYNDNCAASHYDLLIKELEKIKQLVIAEQARIVKELEEKLNHCNVMMASGFGGEAYNSIAAAYANAIKIVKGEK